MARIEWSTQHWPLFVTVLPPSFKVDDVEVGEQRSKGGGSRLPVSGYGTGCHVAFRR